MAEAVSVNWDTASQLVKLVGEFEKSKRDDQEIDFDEAVSKVAAAFGVEDVEATAENVLKEGASSVFGEDGSDQIARLIAGMCMPVGRCVYRYAAGGSSPAELVAELDKIYAGNAEQIAAVIQEALGFEIPPEFNPILAKYSISAISVYCFAAAYKIYQQAAEDARLARERRIEIERLCAESIAQLKARREEMASLVDGYLLNNIGAFAAGVDAMDQAVLDNDDDGYIAAHSGLWELFGRKTQYKNASEFDELMLSDTSFRL